jgi:hypothetical protein
MDHQISTLQDNILNGDKFTKSQVIVKLFKNDIICDEGVKIIYAFDSDTALFQKESLDSIVCIVMEKCIHFCSSMNERLKNIYDRKIRNLGKYKIMAPSVRMALNNLQNSILISQLDQTPYLLSTKNKKVVDLKTGLITERKREHLFTAECPYEFDKDADVSEIYKYIESIMGKEKANLFSLEIGFSLTGDVSQRINIHEGYSNNGMTTFFNRFLRKTIGQFYFNIPFEFTKKTKFKIPNHPSVEFRTARILVCDYFQVRDINGIQSDERKNTIFSKLHFLSGSPSENEGQFDERFKFFVWPFSFQSIQSIQSHSNPCNRFGEQIFPQNEMYLEFLEEKHLKNFFSYVVQFAIKSSNFNF